MMTKSVEKGLIEREIFFDLLKCIKRLLIYCGKYDKKEDDKVSDKRIE